MRIGFIARGLEEDFRFAKEHGIGCVEFNLAEDMTLCERTEEINGWRATYGVAISHVGLYGRDYLTYDEVDRERHWTDLRRAMDFAEEIGAPLITTGGGVQGRRTMREASDELFRMLPPLLEYAEAKGLRFAFHNGAWANFIVGPPMWDRVLDHFPSVGITFDPSHAQHDGKDWLTQLRDYGPMVRHVHAKDPIFIDGKHVEDVPPGMGSIAWGTFIAMLRRHGYDADINIEPHSPTWLGERFYAGILIGKRRLEQFIV